MEDDEFWNNNPHNYFGSIFIFLLLFQYFFSCCIFRVNCIYNFIIDIESQEDDEENEDEEYLEEEEEDYLDDEEYTSNENEENKAFPNCIFLLNHLKFYKNLNLCLIILLQYK